jgi:hypothetical protein
VGCSVGWQTGPPCSPDPLCHGQHTCNGVQGSDDECEDSGEVEVPAQADVHKECPCIQVNLGKGKGRQGLEVTIRHRAQNLGAATDWLCDPGKAWHPWMKRGDSLCSPSWGCVEGGRKNWL